MIKIDEIRQLHIEPSSLCNARCPLCPRSLWGYPHNQGYRETSLSLELVQRRLTPQLISQLDSILFNGNFGDFTANLEILEIIGHIKSIKPGIFILTSTNGSARSRDFWQQLGKFPNIEVEFCLDGLEDTHHLYRQDTSWQRIIDNAAAYISSGGAATWKMIRFDHNQHQTDDCRQLSRRLGFSKFVQTDHGRNSGPSFNRDGSLSHNMGGYEGFKSAESALSWLESDPHFDLPAIKQGTIGCKAKKSNSIYISADGKVYPCCWLGFSPETYDKNYLGLFNKQIKSLVNNNDLHHNSLEECLEWFENVEESWNKHSYSQGRLMQCEVNCGRCKQ